MGRSVLLETNNTCAVGGAVGGAVGLRVATTKHVVRSSGSADASS